MLRTSKSCEILFDLDEITPKQAQEHQIWVSRPPKPDIDEQCVDLVFDQETLDSETRGDSSSWNGAA